MTSEEKDFNMNDMKPILVKLSGSEKYTRLLAGAPSTAGMRSGYVTLLPGEAVGEHRTDAREEAIIVIEGRASVYRGKELLFAAEEESLVYIPPETDHDIKNETDKKLRYVYVVAPVSV
jgi:quercetin dioxygenase-like cupin family protein